jgi:hypothetical protein
MTAGFFIWHHYPTGSAASQQTTLRVAGLHLCLLNSYDIPHSRCKDHNDEVRIVLLLLLLQAAACRLA